MLLSTTGCGQLALGVYLATQSGGGGGGGSGSGGTPTFVTEVSPLSVSAVAPSPARVALLPGTTTFFDPGQPAQVTVGNAPATNVRVLSPTTLEFTAPPNPQGNRSGGASITVRQGAIFLNGLNVAYAAEPPTIARVDPNTGSTQGFETVEVEGTGFVSGCEVEFGGTRASNVQVASPDRLTCTTPFATAGTVDVTVRHPDLPGREARLANAYTYVAPPPPAASGLAYFAQPLDTSAGTPVNPVLVQLVDANGNLVTTANAQISIGLGANPGGATLSGTTTVSTTNGVATFNGLTLDRAGTGYTLVASTAGLPSTSSAAFSVGPGAPSSLVIQTQPTDVVAGTAISPALVVRVEDAFGNQTTGNTLVGLSILNNPGGASLSGTIAVNAVNGIATFDNVSLNRSDEGYALRANALGGSLFANTQSFDVLPGPAVSLGFILQPRDTSAGSQLSPSVIVGAYDALGNLVTNQPRTIGVSVATGPAGALLSGTTTATTASFGGASFTDLSLDRSGTYELTAASAGLPSVISDTFVIAPGPLAQIAYLTQPSDLVSGQVLTPGVEVELLDALGNRLTTNDTVSLSLSANPGAAQLGGTTTVNAAAGVATFPGLTLGAAGSGYALQAASGTTTRDSATFDVSPGPPARLSFTTSGDDHPIGGVCPLVVARVVDADGNTIPGAANTISLSLTTNPAGAALGGTTSKSASGGVVAFDDLTLDQVGAGYVFTASAPGLTSATGDPFAVLALPEVSSVTVGAGPLSGCVEVSYTIRQADALPVDVLVEFDEDASGAFSIATQGDDALGSATSGTQALGTSAAGQAYVYHWNSTRDLRHAATTSARIRVTPLLNGRRGTSFTLSGVSLRNAIGLGTAVTTAAGAGPTAVAVGDVNRDGHVDAVTTDPVNANVVVLLGSAAGWGTPTAYPCGSDPQAVELVDLDRDGDLDVVVARTTADEVSVLLGTGAGTFGTATSFSTGTAPVALGTGDLNADGVQDVVTTNTTSGDVSVLLGDGSGGLGSSAEYSAGTTPRGLCLADANRDGSLDVLVSLPADGELALLAGDGTGGLGTPTTLSAGATPFGIACADLDQDGQLDLVVTHETTEQVSVLRGTAAGTWAAPTSLSTAGAEPVSVALVDQNLDGALDLVVACRGADSLSVFLATSPGSFSSPVVVSVGSTPTGLATADVDREGARDLLVACAGSGLTVVPAEQPERCGDGYELRGERTWGSGQRFDTGDANRDGRVDVLAADWALTWNAGSGPFTPGVLLSASVMIKDVQLADVDEDGFLDALGLGSTVYIRQGDGAGGFTVLGQHGYFGDRFHALDLNADGHVDLLGGWGNVGIGVCYGDGSGSFGVQFNLDADGSRTYPVACGDLDADGDLDVFSTTEAGRLVLFRARGDGTFGTHVDLGSAYPYSEIAAADLNADGRADLVVAEGNGQVRVWLANSNGGFDISTHSGYTAEEPCGAVIGDVDQDGTLDVVVAHKDPVAPGGGYALLRGLGGGVLDTPSLLATDTEPGDLALVDLNGDTWLDLASGPRSVSGVRVLYGSAAGFDEARDLAGHDEPECAVVRDVNRDGRPDLLVTNRTTDDIALHLGQGNGDLAPPTRLSVSPGQGPIELVVVDLNRDGLLDLVVACSESRNVAIRLATAPGTWAGATVVPLGGGSTEAGTRALVVEDLNRDGELDLAVVNGDGNTLSIVLATGPASFGSAVSYPLGDGPYNLVGADLDRDGDVDLVLGYLDEGRLEIRWNDGGGAFGASTVQATSNRTGGVSIADLDQDGFLDVVLISGDTPRLGFGDGSGGFFFKGVANYLYTSLANGAFNTLVAELDHDGLPDVLLTGRLAEVGVYLGLTGRLIEERQVYVTPAETTYSNASPPHPPSAVGDLDRDGLLDVVTVTRTRGRVTVQLAR